MNNQMGTYQVIFPNSPAMKREQSTRALAGLVGEPIPRPRGEKPALFALEVLADHTGSHHHVSFPSNFRHIVENILTATIPGIGIQQGMDFPTKWDLGCAITISSPIMLNGERQPISDKDIGVVLTHLGRLREREFVLVQWIVWPSWQLGYRAAGRIVVKSPHPIRSAEILREVLVGFGQLQVIRARTLTTSYDLKRVADRLPPSGAWPVTTDPIDLPVAALWPIDAPAAPGMTYSRGISLIPEAAVGHGPIILGTSNFPGMKRTVGLGPADLTVHHHIIGVIGTGKSTYMINQMLQWVEMEGRKYGLMFVDPHRDAAYHFIDALPPERIKDVILLDFTKKSTHPPGFNLLEGNSESVANQMLAIFRQVSKMEDQVHAPNLLRYGAMALSDNGMTVLELRLLMDSTDKGTAFRDRIIPNIKNARAKEFWEKFNGESYTPKMRETESAALLRRLEPFESWEQLWSTLGQSRSKFDFNDVLAQGKIVVVILDPSDEAKESSQIIGSIIISRFMSAVRNRAILPESKRTPFGLYVDEVHKFATISSSFSDMLDEMRKFGLCFTMAHQRIRQVTDVSPGLWSAIMSNARNKSILKVDDSDASVLAKGLPNITPQNILSLRKRELIVRLTANGDDTAATTITALPTATPLGNAEEVVRASQDSYGTPIDDVRAEIEARRGGEDGPSGRVAVEPTSPPDPKTPLSRSNPPRRRSVPDTIIGAPVD